MASPATFQQIRSLRKEIENDTRADAARLDELRRVLAQFHKDRVDSSGSGAVAKWSAFLQQSHQDLVKQLTQRIEQGQRTAIRTFWGVIASSPALSHGDQVPMVNTDLVRQWIRATLQVPLHDKTIRHMLQAEFLEPYRDVQYYALSAIAEVAGQKPKHPERLLELLVMIPVPVTQEDVGSNYLFPPPGKLASDSDDDEEEDDTDDEASVDSEDDDDVRQSPSKKAKLAQSFNFTRAREHHRSWSKAWLAVLRLSLPTAALKQALLFLPQHVLPLVPNPLRFADFFMEAYDHTGVLPILALDGLFQLMIDDGLEYPDFYRQLYRLVTPQVLFVKYRLRFFRLLDKCLTKNDMLPAHIVAAFCKRLLRSALTAPPQSTLWVLALVSNLLRKHPETLCLIHRDAPKLDDAFDAENDDPEQAQALQSSLWELDALSQHSLHSVATLAQSIGRDQNLPLHHLENLLQLTYRSLFEQERKRRTPKAPVTFREPNGLFEKDDLLAGLLETR